MLCLLLLVSGWQVLPALRSTKRSPGMASKMASNGARLSAQPMIAVCGDWPWSTSSRRKPLFVLQRA